MAAEVTRLEPKGTAAIKVAHDGELSIAYGRSRYETNWKNRRIMWSALLSRLSHSQETGETHAEYMRLPKAQQDNIKDIGGFMGGHLKGGRKKGENVECRQILTLDADYAKRGFTEQLDEMVTLGDLPDVAMAVYSTHKHTAASPRLRLIIPLDREVTPDEYEAIARKVAEKVGIDSFDDSTYQPARMMFWPSHSADVEPVFWLHDAPFLNAADILAEYPDWTDVSYWPMSSREAELRTPTGPAADPLSKKGPVGLFCRTYTVTEAIAKFLPGVYLPTAKPDRYTYAAGSTAAGLVIYNDDTFAWSNHATDPAAGSSCNAFDLVRIHLFRDKDDGQEDKRGQNAPSYKAMRDLVWSDRECKLQLFREQDADAKADFAEPVPGGAEDGEEEKEDGWKGGLALTSTGATAASMVNAALIIQNDPALRGIRFNELSGRIVAEGVPWDRPDVPWRDADDAQLKRWLAEKYKVEFPDAKFGSALTAVTDTRRFHPVKEYLEGLPTWDGVERVDTLLVKYLGADDNIYTREAMRKCLTAAVARVYRPGLKFDSMLVLVGPQGAGKSTLFTRLGRDWFSDTLKMDMMNKIKDSGEQIQGKWIIEIGEMSGMKKAEIEAVKSFISRRDDDFRAAYGHHKESRPRQCVVVGSTNAEEGFLRDVTGNRRFWPVKVRKGGTPHPWDITDAEVDQIWAEVKIGYDLGEDLLLSKEAEALAEGAQREAMEHDDRQGIVEEYLERLLPENWDSMDQDQRLFFLDSTEEGTVRRMAVSNMEIWVEALHGSGTRLESKDAYAIAKIMAAIPGWERTDERKRVNGYGLQRLYRRSKV